jgi:hypothetical protein
LQGGGQVTGVDGGVRVGGDVTDDKPAVLDRRAQILLPAAFVGPSREQPERQKNIIARQLVERGDLSR